MNHMWSTICVLRRRTVRSWPSSWTMPSVDTCGPSMPQGPPSEEPEEGGGPVAAGPQ